MTRIARGPRSGATRLGAARRRRTTLAELAPRIGSAIVLMAAALGATIAGGTLFQLLWLAASVGILWEWQRLVGGARCMARFAVGVAALAGGAVSAATGLPVAALFLLIGGAVVLAVVAERGKRLISASGLFYAGALILAVVLLRQSAPRGQDAIFWLFAVVWGTDCMAYFGGRLIGGPKLAPRFSPSKTWAGFAVGIVSGSLLGLAVSPRPACTGCMLVLGLLAGAVAQGGDLFESSLKRRFKVKDAGSLIPGHGGLMDRLDGFIAASVFAAGVGIWRFGVGAAGAGLFQW